MLKLEDKATVFATKAHEGQVRKYTGEPYINHPCEVVEIVRSVSHNEFMLAAAWLHDVVEDTPVTLWEIWKEFGFHVACLVEELTDISKPEDGNREVRKAVDRLHTANASPSAKTIKLADLISNTGSIVEFGKGFAKIYLAEKRLLLDFLQEGDEKLWKQAHDLALK